MQSGQYFGEMGLLNNANHSVTVLPRGPLICYVMPKPAFVECFMLKAGATALRILQVVSRSPDYGRQLCDVLMIRPASGSIRRTKRSGPSARTRCRGRRTGRRWLWTWYAGLWSATPGPPLHGPRHVAPHPPPSRATSSSATQHPSRLHVARRVAPTSLPSHSGCLRSGIATTRSVWPRAPAPVPSARPASTLYTGHTTAGHVTTAAKGRDWSGGPHF